MMTKMKIDKKMCRNSAAAADMMAGKITRKCNSVPIEVCHLVVVVELMHR